MAIEMEEVLSPEETARAIVADVLQLAAALRRWADAMAAGFGQSQARWQVLSLAATGNRTVPEIARRLGLSRQAVQRVANLLTEEGKARCIWDRDHLNSPILRLTMYGRDVLDKLNQAAAAFHKELARGADPNALDDALHVLRKFFEDIERDLSQREKD